MNRAGLESLSHAGEADPGERHVCAAGPDASGAGAAPLSTPITIAVDGPDALVHPRHADLVDGVLAGWACASRPKRATRAAPEFGWWGGGTYRFPSKLAVAVGAALIDRGHRVRLGPFRSPPLGHWDAVDPVVRALIGEPRFARAGGLLTADLGIDVPRVFFQLLWLWPRGRVVLAAPPRRVRAWRRYLTGPHLGRYLVTTGSDDRLWRGRRAVLVTTLGGLDLCQPDDFDLALVPDARPLANRPLTESGHKHGVPRWRVTYPVLREWRVPAFGYLPGPTTDLSGAERLTLGSFFGRTLAVPDSIECAPPVGGAGDGGAAGA